MLLALFEHCPLSNGCYQLISLQGERSKSEIQSQDSESKEKYKLYNEYETLPEGIRETKAKKPTDDTWV